MMLKTAGLVLAGLTLAVALGVGATSGSTWLGSGSTGVDGAFVLTATDPRVANGIFVFDPVRDNWDLNGTNVYNFTQITIPNGVTVQIRANKLRNPGPIVWLSSGPVVIAGIVDASGNNGHDATTTLSLRAPSQPGPGGFAGGAGAKNGDVPQRGFGPGGGIAPTVSGGGGCSAGFSVGPYLSGNYGGASRCTGGGNVYGTALMQPFIGGSGGSGGSASNNYTGAGGGAGGGAIRITSDVSIALNRTAAGTCCSTNAYFTANGGGSGNAANVPTPGGGGSGGSIYLQAPSVSIGYDGSDGLFASGGTAYSDSAATGRIRIDATNLKINTNNISPTPLTAPLANVPPLTGQPTISVVSIAGVPVPVQPSGNYAVPDISVNNMGNIPVVISTANIPNTTINLYITTEPGTADFVTPVTLTNGQGSANITLPQGVSRFVVRATW